MKSKCREAFWDRYRALPEITRRLADKNFELWKQDPSHPSLRFKPVGREMWSVRIGLSYRALGYVENEEIVWYWIGPHSEYDRILK